MLTTLCRSALLSQRLVAAAAMPTCVAVAESLAQRRAYRPDVVVARRQHRATAQRLRRSDAWSGQLTARRAFSTLAGGVRTAKVTPFLLSDPGEGINQCELIKWHVAVDAKIDEFDLICELQHDKANVEITSPYAGVVKKLYYQEGGMAIVGQPLIDILRDDDDDGHSHSHDHAPAAAPAEKQQQPAGDGFEDSYTVTSPAGVVRKALATPAVRRVARENGVDLRRVAGTGPQGRILKGDVLKFLSGGQQQQQQQQPDQAEQKPQQAVATAVSDQVVPIRGIRKAMWQSMTAAAAVPHFGYKDEVLMDRLVEARQSIKDIAAQRQMNVKLSYMPFFIKAASLALLEYPMLNAHVDPNGEHMVYKAAHNIGVAMDTPSGLIVPNIKDVQDKSIWQIAVELQQLMEQGAAGKLTGDQLKYGTFTLSNIGNVGGTYAFPVVMVPQVAIGALGRMQRVPRYPSATSTEAVPTQILNVSWSADHRVIEGATMARFSNLWKSYIENPAAFLINLK